MGNCETGAKPAWREHLTRWLAPLVLFLPGIVWFPAEAEAGGPRAATAGSLWLKTSAEAEPVAALGVATGIEARVTGSIARVEVMQRFVNSTDQWVEGLYVFPLAADAAVDHLEMQLGERVIRGEIQPRVQAGATYEAARISGRRASLVDQERPNLFTTAVANIEPHGEVVIRIAYLEVIPWRDGRYTLKLPLAITPRYTPGVAIDPAGPLPLTEAAFTNAWLGTSATPERVTPDTQQARIEIELAPGFPLATLHSLHHAVAVKPGAQGERVRVIAERAAADRDFELNWTPVLAPDTQAAAYVEEFNGETHALVMLTPPEAPPGEMPPREVIFVIDTSGSMGGPPMEQARAALALGVARLGPSDRFNIIRFSSDAIALFAAARPADELASQAAQRFIAGLNASGGTEMRAALTLALAAPQPAGLLRQVVFITDGSVGNEAEIVALVRERLGDARLFTVGIGAAPNAWFMHEAAAAGRGGYTFIADIEQVQTRMSELFARLERPALVALELHWPGGLQPELARPLPGDLYAGDPLAIAVRIPAGLPRGTLTLAGQSGNGAWVRQVPLVKLKGEAGIARLWARERIAELGRRKRLGGRPDAPVKDLDAAILELALAYGLVSEQTSLVAVDATPARPPGAPDRQAQAPTAAPSGGAWARSAAFPVTATPAPLLAWLGLLSLAMAGLLRGGAWRL